MVFSKQTRHPNAPTGINRGDIMYTEEKNLREQVNELSEELRNVKMQLQALYKHFNLNVKPWLAKNYPYKRWYRS